jgi:hypothetical protein
MANDYSAAELIRRIQQYRGNISAVARSYGRTRGAILYHVKKYPTVQAALEEERETLLDDAESILWKQIIDGNTTALIFFLKTQGKKRGYVERQEQSGPDGGPITVQEWKKQADENRAKAAKTLEDFSDDPGG